MSEQEKIFFDKIQIIIDEYHIFCIYLQYQSTFEMV